jgi:hypothetical protein
VLVLGFVRARAWGMVGARNGPMVWARVKTMSRARFLVQVRIGLVLGLELW